jgi:hypothetical protein
MKHILILTILIPLLFGCKRNASSGNQQSLPSTARASASSDTLITQASIASESEEPPEIDTITVFLKSDCPKGFRCRLGKWTYYSANRSFLLCNGSYALADWPSLNDQHVTAVYKLPIASFPDTIAITSADTAIFRFSENDQSAVGFDGNFLFMDFGCCAGPRGLMIFDLASRDTILNSSYTVMAGYDSLQTIFFYAPYRPATKNDCPDFEKQIKQGLEPYLEQLYSFNLTSKRKREIGKFRCSAYS